MVQWKNRNDGGMAKASSSVLKLASTIQRIGKKIRKPASQAPAVAMIVRRVVTARAMVSRLQIPADDADKEESHDVGDDDGHEPARGGTADIVLNEGLGVDQESDVRGLQSRAAAGGDEDLGE